MQPAPPLLLATLLAALLCALVAGFLFAFAAVAMPGLRTLDDRAFLRAFRAVDRVIQNNQPVFLVVWVGSLLSVLAAVALGVAHGPEARLIPLFAGAPLHVLGVHLPTVAVHLPLNRRLQALAVDDLTDAACRDARAAFEPRWNRWNRARTLLAVLAAALLLVQLLFFRVA